MECPLCLAELPIEFFPTIQSCHHRSCYDCFQQYLKVEISESRVNIACPECSEALHPNGEHISSMYYRVNIRILSDFNESFHVNLDLLRVSLSPTSSHILTSSAQIFE